MNSIVSSVFMYPGSLFRSGIKSATKTGRKLVDRFKLRSSKGSNITLANTVTSTKASYEGHGKPVAIQEC